MLEPNLTESAAPLPLQGFEYVRFFVEDSDRWLPWFTECLGCTPIATNADVEKVEENCRTAILQLGAIEFHLSAPKSRYGIVGQWLERHPAGVAELGLAVPSSVPLPPPCCYGDVTHRFVHRDRARRHPIWLGIDHAVLNVPAGDLAIATTWYIDILGLRPGDRFDIRTIRSGLHSLVVENTNRSLKLPINEPSTANSQIQDFLTCHRGAGIQHVALRVEGLEDLVAPLRGRGLHFLRTEPGILVDRVGQEGELRQIFTLPIFDTPTFFFELIQRKGDAQGFGEGNFRTLFEAIEREKEVYGAARPETRIYN